jgi:ABC-type cobalamin/Fe3+-siderophores transport system ATPase subunit
MRLFLSATLFCALCADAFVPRGNNNNNQQRAATTITTTYTTPITTSIAPRSPVFRTTNNAVNNDPSLVILFAKKQKGNNAKAAALDALDTLDVLDEPLSKKDQKELLKKQKKEEAKEAADAAEEVDGGAVNKQLTKKEKMLAKALALDALDAEQAAASSSSAGGGGDDVDGVDRSQLSKKELKALKKKEEKMALKAEKKSQKMADKQEQFEDNDNVNGDDNDDDESSSSSEIGAETVVAEIVPEKATLEDKIRKERPPPRIRVMESAQPGFVSLRMENVGITFRNQEVLKDVTWGVQSGDRIGLVGKNGAGKTTQLRIMANELEPTTGDVVKSSMDLRTAMLRQEFVDELIKERTLKEEFMSVFEEENKIVQDLKDAESKLESMSDANPEEMQEILDRMQELQQKAEDKEVYALESRVKKTMDLMGFNEEEGEDLVASFSGGWKMRIGLGKVLLKDPNVLLLGEYT